jgi:hypothetical protein
MLLGLSALVLVLLAAPSRTKADDFTNYIVTFTQTSGPDAAPYDGYLSIDNTDVSFSEFGGNWDQAGGGYDFEIPDAALTTGWAGIGALIPACDAASPTQQVLNVFEGCTGSDVDWAGTYPENPSALELEFSIFTEGTTFGAVAVAGIVPNEPPYIVDSGYLTITPETVATPEPAILSLLAIGLVGLVLLRRKTNPVQTAT